jgi:hypothetical protein
MSLEYLCVPDTVTEILHEKSRGSIRKSIYDYERKVKTATDL